VKNPCAVFGAGGDDRRHDGHAMIDMGLVGELRQRTSAPVSVVSGTNFSRRSSTVIAGSVPTASSANAASPSALQDRERRGAENDRPHWYAR